SNSGKERATKRSNMIVQEPRHLLSTPTASHKRPAYLQGGVAGIRKVLPLKYGRRDSLECPLATRATRTGTKATAQENLALRAAAFLKASRLLPREPVVT